MSCACENFIKNTGLARCKKGEELPYKIFVQSLRDRDGNKNGIDLTDLPTADEYLDNLVNESDPFKRLYPINEEMFAVERAENEPDTEDVDGVPIKLRDGNKTIQFTYRNVPIKMNSILKSLECSDFGVYFLFRSGNLQGELSKDKLTLYPLPVDNRTFRSVFSHSFSTTSTITVNAMFDRLLKDENIVTLSSEAFIEDTTDLGALVDLTAKVVGTPTNTTLVVDFKTGWGTIDRLEGMEGKVADDFIITNNNMVVVKTALEDADIKGRYTFTLTAVLAGDILVLGLNPNVKYFELKPITIVIPN